MSNNLYSAECFEVNVAHVIATLVNAKLPRNTKNYSLEINADVSVKNLTPYRQVEHKVSFVFSRPFNAVAIWIALDKNPHVPCWFSEHAWWWDGIDKPLKELFFVMCGDCASNVPPANLEPRCYWPINDNCREIPFKDPTKYNMFPLLNGQHIAPMNKPLHSIIR